MEYEQPFVLMMFQSYKTKYCKHSGLLLKLQIPVFKGAASPLLGQDTTDDGHYHHGNDGMGGVPDPDPPSGDLIQSEHAVCALIRMAYERPGEITLVAIGPLTNLALATKMDPEFSTKLKELVIMGGNIEGKMCYVFF